jgi:two-component system response regulator DesR
MEPPIGGDIRLTCLVAHRHPNVREALALLLEDEGFTVVGKAATSREAIRLAERHRPDLIVVDFRLDTMTGIDVARVASRLGLSEAIVLHTADATPQLVRKALDAGVSGIARQAVPPLSLLNAIAASLAREVYVDPAFGGIAPGYRG